MQARLLEHWPEYLCELLGTAIMMMIGVGAIIALWSPHSPWHDLVAADGPRRLVTGCLFAGGATLVVLSPIGQRSGGHLNPAVTLAFWWREQIAGKDAVAYVIAQLFGALLGVALLEALFGAAARDVQLGLTAPGDGISLVFVFLAEVGITALLMLLILVCLNNQRFAAGTPFFAGGLVATLVFVEAPVSGTSLNPARSFAPALLMHEFSHQWIYWTAPFLGALLAVKLFALAFAREGHNGCAKLYHTERYRCIFLHCGYEQVAAGTVLMRQGEPATGAYVIERGELEVRVQTAAGIDVALARLKPGDWVGEMALLLELPRSATVVAVTDAQLRLVTASNLAHVIAEHPVETARLLKQVAARLHEADMRLSAAQEAPATST